MSWRDYNKKKKNILEENDSRQNQQKFVPRQETSEEQTANRVKLTAQKILRQNQENVSTWDRVRNIANNISRDTSNIVNNFGLGVTSSAKNTLYYTEDMSENKFGAYKRYNQTQSALKEKQNEIENLRKNIDNKETPNISNIKLPTKEDTKRNIKTLTEEEVKQATLPKKQDSLLLRSIDESIAKDEEKIQKNVESSTNRVSKKLAELMPSIAQSVTGMGASVINPAIGLGFWQTSAGGGYTREAEKNGYTGNDAMLYGTIMGSMESATEWIGGELTKGVGKAFFKKGAVEGIKALGLDIAENFFEEAIMEPIQETVKQAIGKDGDWQGIGSRMLQSGINGALTSIIMGGASAGIGSATNLITKAQSGQQITQKEIADTLKEINKSEEVDIEKILANNFNFTAEDLAVNLDAQQRTEQRLENVAEGMSRNEAQQLLIDNSDLEDSQKEVLSEIANQYNLSDEDIKKAIQNTKDGKYTQNNEVLNQEQQTIQDENKTAQNETSQKTKDDIAKELSNGKFNTYEELEKKAYYESFNEEQLHTPYQDLLENVNNTISKQTQNETSQEQRDLIQDLQKFNETRQEGQEIFDLDNEENVKEVQAIQKLAKKRNINITFDESRFDNTDTNAFYEYDKDGNVANIVLNPNSTSKKYVQNLVIHEMTHSFEGSKQYDSLSKAILDYAKSKGEYKNAFNDLMNTYSKVYSGENLNKIVEKEAVANILGEKLGDKEFVDSLVNNQYVERNIIQKIIDFAKNQINRFRGYKDQEAYWNHVKTLFEDAYNKSEVSKEGLKASVERNKLTDIRDSQGRQLSEGQQEYFKDSKVRDENGNLLEVYHGTPVKEDINVYDSSKAGSNVQADFTGIYFTDNIDFAEQFAHEQLEGSSTFRTKLGERGQLKKQYLNITNPLNLNELTDVSQVEKYIDEEKASEFSKEAMIETLKRAIANKNSQMIKFNLDLNKISQDYDGIIADLGGRNKGSNEYIVFNSNQIKNIDNTNPTTNDDIRYSVETEDLKTDNQGNKINPNMQKFMEKSYAREDNSLNGKLKELYHGTNTGEFYTFDKNKASVEGDWGAGFYLTDNERDVEANYEGGGPDFENKISKLAERIEQDEDISYEEAKEKAREQLEKGGYRITSYANIENPVIIGETKLFNSDDYMEDIESELSDEAENYQEEIEEYTKDYFGVEDLEELDEESLKEARDDYLRNEGIYDDIVNRYVEDDIDKAVYEVSNNLEMWGDTEEELRQILWDAVYNGGIDLQELKDQINEKLEITNENGDLANNEAVRIIAEALGYDGIIDNTVSDKFKNMGISKGTTHYIVFNSNQIKDINNQNPTTNPDIRYSQDTTGAWNNFIEKYFKNEGEGTAIKDLKKLPTREYTIQDYEEVINNSANIPEADKTAILKDLEGIELNKQSLNDFKQYVEDLDNNYKEVAQQQEQQRFENKNYKDEGRANLISEKRKEFNTNMEYDDSVVAELDEIIPRNRNGKRTVAEWKNMAKQLGQRIANMSPEQIEDIAVKSYYDLEPTKAITRYDNVNKTNVGYEQLYANDWVNEVYEGVRENRQFSVETENQETQPTQGVELPKANKILNPTEISNLTPEDASTTPELPNKKYKEGTKVSNFVSNIENDVGFLNNEEKQELLKDDNVKFYAEVTNADTLAKAYDNLKENGRNATIEWYTKPTENATAEDVATGWILLKQYSDKGDTQGMVNVAKKLRDMGTKAGQTVQAFNILSRLTPEGMVAYTQGELQDAYNEMIKGKSKKWIDQHKSDFDLSQDEVAYIMDTMQNLPEENPANNNYDRKVALGQIQKLFTDKIPSENNKIKAWMRISMLFNPKTQVRNVAGNAIVVPVNMTSDFLGSKVDKLLSKYTGVRTLGNANVKAYLEGMKEGFYESYNDFRLGINTRDIQQNKFEFGQGKAFKDKGIGKALNRVDNLLNFVMDFGDRGFSQASFVNSLNNQMLLNGVTTPTQEMIDIATEESLSRTWNDDNDYTRFVLGVRRALNKVGTKNYGLGDVLIPFAKTPANLTKAIVEYSPVGLTKSLLDIPNIKNAIETGQMTAQQQHQFADHLGKGLAGTLLYIAGYALAKSGIATGEPEEDKDVKNFMKNSLGIGSYSIKIGDKSFAYDWAQPVATPLAIMTNLYQTNKNNPDASLLDKTLSAVNIGTNQLLEQSFMESLNEVLNGNGEITDRIQKAILDLPARAIPTFSKQIADMVDGTQRTSFEYGQPVQSAINSAKAKLPFVSRSLTPVIDTLGNEVQKYGGENNWFNVFFNPANMNKGEKTKAGEEIYKVYEQTGDTTIFPVTAPYYVNYDGSKITMDSKQRAEYQKTSGDYTEQTVNDLINDKDYQKLDDTEKAEILSKVVTDSNEKAKRDVLNIDKNSSDLDLIDQVGSDYYTYKLSEKGKTKQPEKCEVLLNKDYSNKNKQLIYSSEINKDDKTYNGLLQINKNLNMNDYLGFKAQTFEGENRKKDMTSYLENSNLSREEQLYILGKNYKLNTSQRQELESLLRNKMPSNDIISVLESIK